MFSGEPPPHSPPRTEGELLASARALAGRDVDSLAGQWGIRLGDGAVHTKGKVGTLIERALGATGRSQREVDFPGLGIELKTIPVDARSTPRESTFVCTASLVDADRVEWSTSWVRTKLARVLWVPLLVDPAGATRVGSPLLWSPSREQDEGLAHDFEEIMGRVAIGGIEGVTAFVGTWLQMRPKAAHGRVRTRAPGVDGDTVATVPRGFYLRARFTGALLRDPGACPR
jgi:DNA mismatch repair protein MutH